MKFLTKTVGAVVFSVALALAFSSHAANIVGSSYAEIREPVALTEVTPLSFGAIVKSSQSDIVTLGPDGNVSDTSGTYQFAGGSTAGVMKITGAKDSFVSISFGVGSLVGGTSSMVMKDFTHNAGATPQLDANGDLIVNIGAALDVASNQQAGVYNGTYSVTVNYQ